MLTLVFTGLCAQLGRADDTNQIPDATVNPPRTALADSKLDMAGASPEIWNEGVGSGFRERTHNVEVSLENTFGVHYNDGQLHHNLGIASVRYGEILGGVAGGPHWYRGNWEFLGEMFGGWQYNPRGAYVAGLTPMLRYSFATSTRWVPFIEGGFGPSVTDIGGPDLSTSFEFNIQGNMGVHYFWNSHQAVTAQVGYFHLSNAGIKEPNQGVNAISLLLGTSWFF
jgi:lipid A 3-O-deacylase